MKSTYLAIFALFVIAAVVFETEATSSTKTSICTPEAFEWLIENCPTESPSRRAVRRLESE